MIKHVERIVVIIFTIELALWIAPIILSSNGQATGPREYGPEYYHWPMDGQNSQRTGQSIYDTKYNNGSVIWKTTINDQKWDTMTTPVIGPDDSIYIGGSDGYLYSFSPEGKINWKFKTNYSIYSSPAVDAQGNIIFFSHGNSLYEVSPTGSLKWNYYIGRDGPPTSPAIMYNGTIIVSSGPVVYVFSPTGQLLLKKIINDDDTAPMSSPAIPGYGSDTILVCTSNTFSHNGPTLSALYSSGIYQWNFTSKRNNPSNVSFCSTPSVAPDGSIYYLQVDTSSKQVIVTALYGVGIFKWDYVINTSSFFRPGFYQTAPAIGNDGTIYVGGQMGNLCAFSPRGKLKWNVSTSSGGWNSANPVIGGDGTIYMIGSQNFNESNVMAFTPDGSKKWSTRTDYVNFSTPAIGSKGTLYFGSRNKSVYALNSAEAINSTVKIDTKDVRYAYVGELYSVNYTVKHYQPQMGFLYWKISTTMRWLDISLASGILEGKPLASDVGNFSISISVGNSTQVFDTHNFTIDVINLTSPPPPPENVIIEQPKDFAILTQEIAASYILEGSATTQSAVSSLIYSWYDNGNLIGDGMTCVVTIKPGNHQIELIVSDGHSETAASVSITVLRTNHPPIDVQIIHPSNNTILTYDEGKDVQLHGTGNDIDIGDNLTYKWYDNGRLIGLANDTTVKLEPGNHILVLKVSDGKTTVQDQAKIMVIRPDDKASDNLDTAPPRAVLLMATSSIFLLVIGFAVVVSLTEVGAYKMIPIIAPFYSKTKKEELLDNFTRGMIFQHIRNNPGTYLNRIKRELELNNGTLIFHLNKLETQGMITSRRDGLKRRFYPTNGRAPSIPSIHERIYSTIRLNPGITQKEISVELDISPSTVNEHVHQMRRAGLITLVQKGNAILCYIEENGHEVPTFEMED